MSSDSPYFFSNPTRIIIEFTSRCNLQCAYCQNAFPQYRSLGRDIDDQVLTKIIDYILQNNVGAVCVNGHGETTIYKNWHVHCNRLLDKGINLGIITNLAKKYSSEELDTLSRFSTIEASCDTSDPELFAYFRKGNTLERFMGNINAIRQHSQIAGRQGPVFNWSCVITDKNIFGLLEFMQFGIQNNINQFNFCNYYQLPEIKDRQLPIHIADLPDEQFFQAAFVVKEIMNRFSAIGIKINVNEVLVNRINNRIKSLQSGECSSLLTQTVQCIQNMSHHKDGLTRNCNHPWDTAFILNNGEVRPCCVYRSVGKLDKNSGLEDIYNGDSMRQLRQSLCDGNLIGTCADCPSVGLTDVDLFRNHIMKNYGTVSPQVPSC